MRTCVDVLPDHSMTEQGEELQQSIGIAKVRIQWVSFQTG